MEATTTWSAQFITSGRPAGNPDDPAVYLRRDFDVAEGLVSAQLHVTAVGLIEPHLNGEVVGDEVLAPGWTSYRHRLVVSTHDVTASLRPGANALGAIVGQGWAVGRLGWEGKRHHWSDQPAGWMQLDLHYGDRVETIASGPEFRAGTGGVCANSLYDGETFDATLEPTGWDQPGFDDHSWEPVALHAWDPATLTAPRAPGIRRTEELPPVSITESAGTLRVDFGQIITGWVRLTVAGAEPGTQVVLRHSELLHEDGSLDVRTLRTAQATDRWILADAQPATFEPRFTFHGFRYVEISGHPGPLAADDIRAVVVHSPLERTGWFSSSNHLLDQLHENTVWSMRGNFVGVPTDCPQRDERLGWTGDINAFAPTAVLLHDAQAFLRNWLADLRAEQAAAGQVPWVVPDVTSTPSSPTALWSDVAVSLPWTLFWEYGDPGILEESYHSMVTFTRQVAALLDDEGLWSSGFQFGDWLDPDAPPDNPAGGKTDRHLVASAYFCLVTQHMALAARELATPEAAEFEDLAARVREAFRNEYVTAGGRITGESATAYALAISFGILEPDQEQKAGAHLAHLVARAGYTISTGFAGTPWMLPALASTGQWEAAYQLLTQTRCPSFLYPVTMDATTIWERWDALTPDGQLNDHGMTSLNHYALGAVSAWLYEAVAGIAATAPGWRRFRVAPRPGGGLTHARATHHTVLGRVSAGWRIHDAHMSVEVVVPEGATAQVVLPLDPDGRILDVGPGEHAWRYALPESHGRRPDFSMDTPLSELASDTATWTALTRVFEAYLPGIPIDGNDPQAASISLDVMLQFIPHPPEGFRRDLEATLRDPAHADDVRPPAAGADDDVAQAADLLSGASFWATRPAEGLRALTLSDGPHGVRLQDQAHDHLGMASSLPATCFPPAAASAGSFDVHLLHEIGQALGAESSALGVDVLLGPGVNIKRSPLGGRNFEYFSEDPLLTGVLAAAWVRGVQSAGVGTSLKHFAVNNQETERMTISAEVDERTLREIYLPAFEHVVRHAQPATVMSAYNAINGVHASENRWLLTELLRDEWGFDGLVVSDWGAVKDRAEALRAGLDLEMPSSDGAGTQAIVAAIREGRITRQMVEQSVARLRRLAERAVATPGTDIDFDAHHRLARRAAAASIVLLRNDGVLPLQTGVSVAVIGALATEPQFQGGGSSHVNAARVDVPLDELRKALGDENITFAPGYPTGPQAGASEEEATRLLDQAVETARGAQVAVVFAGLEESQQSEGFDRDTLDLPANQVRLIQAVSRLAPTVVVLSNGGVVSLEPWHDATAAIVETWAAGQAMGGAVADLLVGRVNPSGRLAETIPLALSDTPTYLNFPGEQGVVRHGEGVFVGYRFYTTAARAVRYPFGHGLSYTTFTQELLDVEVTGRDTATAQVRVTNTGQRDGAEVVQLYVAAPSGPVRRPARELAGFAKVHLAPGQSETVEIVLDRRRFAYWDTQRGDWAVTPGSYGIELARNAAEVIETRSIDLEGDQHRVRPLRLDSGVKEWFEHPLIGPLLQEAMLAGASPEQRAAAEANAHMLRMVETMPMSQFARFPGVDLSEELLTELARQSAE